MSKRRHEITELNDKEGEKLGRKDKIWLFLVAQVLWVLYLIMQLCISHYFPLGMMYIINDMISFTIGLACVMLLAILMVCPSYWDDVRKVLDTINRIIGWKASKHRGGKE